MRKAASRFAWTGSLVLLGCQASGSDWEPCAYLTAEPLSEVSGMVQSRVSPDLFWVHNDSGDAPRLFAIDRNGVLRAEVEVDGADNVDWEDIAADDDGNLYIGDFGNNANKRTDLVIYVVPEPRLELGSGVTKHRVSVTRRIPYYYPEQRAFPDRNERNYDCEAMFWDAGSLYLLTKHRSDARTVLYRVSLTGDGRRAAQRLGDFDAGSQITAADLSPDGSRLLVLSYQYLFVFERPEAGDDFLSAPHRRILIEGRQCEAICFDGERLMFANEQREIYCLQLDDLLQRGSFLPETPHLDIPRLTGAPSTAAAAGRSVPLHAATEAGARLPAGSKAPSVSLAWSHDALHVAAAWENDAPTGKTRTLMYLMLGSPGTVPELGPDQAVWEVRESREGVRVRRVRPQPKGPWLPGVAWKRNGSRLEFQASVPAAARAGTDLAFNVVVFGGRDRTEWYWSASTTTEPERNPLLWGRLRLQDGPASR